MKRIAVISLIASIVLCTISCAPKTTTKQEAFPQMYSTDPLVILVLPPINQTTAVDAKEYYATTIAEPLSYAGYYILPIEVTTDILKSEGIYDTELIANVPLNKFKDFFGADAVMFIYLSKWDTAYYVIGGHMTVAATLILKSTSTGDELWKYKGMVRLDTSGGSGGGGMGGLIAKVIITALKTAASDYVPIARRVSFVTVSSIPYGKYHPQHGKDGGSQIIKQEPKPAEATAQ